MHRVVALVRAPQALFELGGAAGVFADGPYSFGIATEHPGPVATTAGQPLVVADGLDVLGHADTVIVPGWLPAEDPPSPAVVDALRAAHARGSRLASICTGAFALAHAGLLEGRRATTHWARTDDLARRYPGVEVDPDVLYVDHGDVATSAGSGAGVDLCLHLLRTDQGAFYAARVARRMVMPPHREGGQRQYAAPPRAEHVDASLAPLLDWASRHLAEPLTLDVLAARAGTSARTLSRHFVDQLGIGPGGWLLGRRIDAARDLLETTTLPVEAVARQVGLGSATNLRRRFSASVGTTPSAYRRAFHGRDAGVRG